ncbi:metallophosphoesterase [Photobacterium lipolyticum]|uniref:PKD/Chitinase domain-containing protein n=1 Tax=Photobacterium lipolyticum TaxID=266810 RepID=A0A2T3MUT7_9GAMM|nr:Ig-like domain-containing protein [Photobacterium lipolyticum]PSW03729.1 hypothetical protein C9I89_16485 [Photobacterium lipolyticum]
MYGINLTKRKTKLSFLFSSLDKAIYYIFVIPVIFCLLTVEVSAEPTILEVRVSASTDDAEEKTSGGMRLTSSDLEFVYDGGDQTVGMRFNTVTIPAGASITDAYIQFQADETNSETTSLMIEGVAEDSTPTFSGTFGNLSSRSRTVSFVSWAPAPWTVVGEAGLAQRTPSITSIIQEIVNRPGWLSGNSLVIIVTGTGERVAEAFDGVPGAAPLLHVEYTGAGNSTPTVSITEPADNTTFPVGDPVTFASTASDSEDGDLTGSLAWSSSRDGGIGTGGSFSISTLSQGTHTITASVTDSGGLAGTDQITVTVGDVPAMLDVRVASSSDDAEEKASGAMKLASSDLELVYDGSVQTVGMRFNAVAIPPGASIEHAYIQLQVDETSTGTTSLTLVGENSEDATTFTSSSGNISSRNRTTNTVSWSPPSWTTVGEAGPDQQTPDIAPIIQEIVNQPGWSSGNSLVIIVTGTGERAAEAYDGATGAAPLLHVEYTATGNTTPTVGISAPADNASFAAGDAIAFSGTASDSEDGDLLGSLSWISSLDGTIGTGGSFSTSSLSAGTHTITASVSDSGGLAGSAQITVTVTVVTGNTAPTVGISTPADNASFAADDAITFSGTANDTEDDDLGSSLSWSSNLDGTIGTGGSFSTSSLSVGTHTITASVSDSGGLAASAQITVTVGTGNITPTVGISAPADNASFVVGDMVTFSGTANDTEDGDLGSSLGWSSNLDGIIGTGGAFSTSSLSAGTHTITASVSDSEGQPASAQITVTVTVVTANTAPTVGVSAPAGNASFAVGDTVTFSGTATDAEDGDLGSSLAWSSSLDGAIGTGGAFSTSSLSEGNHTITASVSDTGGLAGSAQITVTVGEAATTLDVRVAASSDDAEEIASGRIRLTSADLEFVYDGSEQTVGLRFNGVTMPQGASIERAYIQLQADETNSDTTLLAIEAEITDNASTFTSSEGNVSLRKRTSNSVSWFPPPWTTVGEAGPDQRTPDIAPIIQEIVDQPEWVSGNSLAIIISGIGERVAESFEGKSAAAPLLHVEYRGGEDNLVEPPEITFFTPASAQVASVVEITGSNFREAINVAFNGISSTFRVASGNTIYATVPPGDASGPITVSDLKGNAISATEFSLVPSPPVLVGAGDIGECVGVDNGATASLLDNIAGTVFTAGDNVHGNGTIEEFADCFDQTWGRHKHRTRPAPGNHEHETIGAADYFEYFGPAAGELGKGYYSYDVGDWHIIVLNSECHKVGGCESDSPQGLWLQANLLKHPSTCTLAIWHQPRFSSGHIGNNPGLSDFWQMLYDAGAELVISGHSHGYERFAPQDVNGAIDTLQGIRQFVVGTGGVNVVTIPESEIAPNSEVHDGDTHGVIKLTLNPGSYEWEFIPVEGKVFSDSGSTPCH